MLSAAAAVRLASDGKTVEQARLVLGAVASRPQISPKVGELLRGKPLTDATIAEAADVASKLAKPMDNTDFTLHWRKRVAREFATYALREVRGDDMREIRKRVARHLLE